MRTSASSRIPSAARSSSRPVREERATRPAPGRRPPAAPRSRSAAPAPPRSSAPARRSRPASHSSSVARQGTTPSRRRRSKRAPGGKLGGSAQHPSLLVERNREATVQRGEGREGVQPLPQPLHPRPASGEVARGRRAHGGGRGGEGHTARLELRGHGGGHPLARATELPPQNALRPGPRPPPRPRGWGRAGPPPGPRSSRPFRAPRPRSRGRGDSGDGARHHLLVEGPEVLHRSPATSRRSAPPRSPGAAEEAHRPPRSPPPRPRPARGSRRAPRVPRGRGARAP